MTNTQTSNAISGRQGSWLRGLFLSLATLTFTGAMAGGIVTLHGQAGAVRSMPANPPLVVDTRPIELRKSYRVKERFVGLFEATRQTRLSFERQGQVTEVLFDEGQKVSAGQVVARLDSSRLKSQRRGLQARLQELEAQFGLASVTLSRQSELNKKGWQSHQKFDVARFKSAQLAAAIRRVKASIASIDIELAKSDLKAPYSGIVAARSIDEGSVVSAGTPVMDLTESSARRARVGVSVAVAGSLKLSRTYRLTSGGREFEGRLFSKRPDLQTGTRTVTALFEVSGAENVPVGRLIELGVERSVKADGVWLPIAALSEGTKGLWTVFSIVGDEGGTTVERKAVEVLHLEGGRAYVRGNFSEKNRIVINGTNRVIPGQRVALASSPNQQ